MKVLYYPSKCIPGHRLWYYTNHLKVDRSNDLNDNDIDVVHHHDYKNERPYPNFFTPFKERGINIINENLVNIKKDHIDDIFSGVFGYSLRINPTEHYGAMVKKGTQNGVHSGKVILGPLPAHMVDTKEYKSGTGVVHTRMYTKFIDTRISHDTIRDYRIVVMGGDPVLLFEKHIQSTSLFHVNKEDRFSVMPHINLFPSFKVEEVNKISQFIKAANVDFAEIDVLRDNSTDQIYIIDINDIPMGPIWDHTKDPDGVLDYLAQTYKTKYL